MKLATIVGHVGGRCKGVSDEQQSWQGAPVESSEIKQTTLRHVEEVFAFLEQPGDERRFDEVERQLRALIFTLARLFLAFFLARREEQSEKELKPWTRRGFRPRERHRKHLNTFFGRITFWRTYVRRGRSKGLFPLDRALGLTADGFSLLLMSASARLSTLLSYEQVTALFLYFLGWSPSKTSVEKAVLGFGEHTTAWFEEAPPPDVDGTVLVIQIDSKGTPTATEQELKKRRGKRQKKERPLSPRHRGKAKRTRRGPKRRRKRGDKSKNARCATIVVMYSLKKARDKDGKPVLLGPINKWVYASYAPKRHAFAIARREADKRGFTAKSGKLIHILTDGDDDLERQVKESFPEARHTLDIMHAIEYFWEAGRFVFKEGSKELATWAKKQERLLYRGRAAQAVLRLNRLDVPQRHRKRLGKICNYLQKRIGMMNYHELRQEDLDVATGVIEGAVRHVIGKRFDSSGMRWIRERAEALLQLRCIEINGDWDAFVSFVGERLQPEHGEANDAARVLRSTPVDLPTYGLVA